MSWANIDDQSTFHAKVIRAGNAAWGALCRLLAWSSAHGTDGKVPADLVAIVATDAERDRLVAVCLLEKIEEGFEIHDFLDWNMSAKDVASTRRKRAKAGRIGGLRSRSKREANASAPASTSDEAKPKQNPTQSNPIQSTVKIHLPVAEPAAKGRRPKRAETTIPDDFKVSTAIEAMCRAEGLPDPHVVIRDFRDWALKKAARYVDWEAAFRTWMRSKITRENYPAMKPETPGFIDGLPIVRHPDRAKFIPKPGEALDMTGLFGPEVDT